jgi:Holliday junction resolvase RusA-like endonuclease
MIILDKFIPVKLKSANKSIYKKGVGSFWTYNKYKKNCHYAVHVYCHKPRQQVMEKVYGKFIRYIGPRGRRMDKDNLYTASKVIRDALKKLGWIYDDSEKWLDYECTQEENTTHGIGIILKTEPFTNQ